VDPDPHWYSAKMLDKDPNLLNPDLFIVFCGDFGIL